MTKEEFIEQLEDALIGEVSNAVIYDNKQYYERYIQSEMRKGRSEQEILEVLGNPRLIARTIIDTQGENSGARYYENQAGYQKVNYDEYEKQTKEKSEDPHIKIYLGNMDLNTWYGKLLILTVFVLFLLLIIWFVTGITALAIKLAVPILIIGIGVYLFKKIFKR